MLRTEPMFSQYWVTTPQEVTRDESRCDLPPSVTKLINEVKDASALTTKYAQKLQPLWKADDAEILKIQKELQSLLKKFDYDGKDAVTNERYLAPYCEGFPLLFDIFHILETESKSFSEDGSGPLRSRLKMKTRCCHENISC